MKELTSAGQKVEKVEKVVVNVWRAKKKEKTDFCAAAALPHRGNYI